MIAADVRRLGPHPRRGEVEVDPRLIWWGLVVATVVAAGLRLPFLGHQSLWLDEIFTRNLIGQPSLTAVWNHVQATESTPPLYYVLAWLLGGRSAASMRALPACALIAAVPVTFLALRRLVGEWPALATAAIVAVSPELVQYSLDARAYGLFVLTGLLSLWAFAGLLERESPTRYLGWVAASVACVWTHYFGFFLVAAEAIVLLSVRPSAWRRTAGWSVVIAACLAPLAPLLSHQNGERAAFIPGIPLMTRLTQTVRQFGMGANVPRTWLEAAGLALALAAFAVGAVAAVRSGTRSRSLVALVAFGFAVPLAVAVLGIEDRFYDRNLLFLLPLLAALAAPALLRLGAAPLAVYLALAVLTSVWVSSNWRYEQADWHAAAERTKALAPAAAVITVGSTSQFSVAVAGTYVGRPATATPVFAHQGWIVVEPYRAPHHRALGPAPVPYAIIASLPGFRIERSLIVHGFRLILLTATKPTPIVPAKLPGAAVFPGPP
ncbi:MAG TPA: glycosyltransferase family 39 protein [Solirubrobacteraceae bacterium]